MKKIITTVLLTLGLAFGLMSVSQAGITSSANGLQSTIQTDAVSAWSWGWCEHKWWCGAGGED
ncbi:hypothetical protein MNBD_GAMMA08-1583 [hydrothermal vent metagenome]|uniref:Uncharacterized protein n=1 Tax=hydrothermal vent metagenome TaxID=652676 RepID=A0A3B0XV15_9ZZZZ